MKPPLHHTPALLPLAALLIGCLSPVWAVAAGATRLDVDPRGTWLFRDACDVTNAPTSLDLASAGIVVGDVLTIERKGSYIYRTDGSTSRRMMAVFTDSSGTLIRPDPAVAVKKIMTGPTYCTSTPTDVREDFDLKSSTQVMVPAGAVFLKFSAPDTLFNDNVSQDYRVIVRK